MFAKSRNKRINIHFNFNVSFGISIDISINVSILISIYIILPRTNPGKGLASFWHAAALPFPAPPLSSFWNLRVGLLDILDLHILLDLAHLPMEVRDFRVEVVFHGVVCFGLVKHITDLVDEAVHC